MKESNYGTAALIGGITSLPVAAILYLANQVADLPFVPFDFFDWLARILPGNLITLTIDAIVGLISVFNLGNTGQTAKIIEQVIAISIFIAGGVAFGLLIAWFAQATRQSSIKSGVIVGLIFFIFTIIFELLLGNLTQPALDIIWLAAVSVSWGVVVSSLLSKPQTGDIDQSTTDVAQKDRRVLLIRLAAGSTAVVLGSMGLSRLFGYQEQDIGANVPIPQPTLTPPPTSGAADQIKPTLQPSPLPSQTEMATTRDNVSPAPGTRSELTSNEAFYRIDINTRSPVINNVEWQLIVNGLFETPINLTLDELMTFPTLTQAITLSCISNRVGGDLIGTSNWTGLRLRDLLAKLGLKAEARSLVVEGTDGFFETVVMEDMLDPRTLLVYGMNGETLPVDHGFPLRIYIPNRYGMKQPKWISSITAVADEPEGYWVQRGWSKEAIPQIVSVIDSVAIEQPTESGLVPMGGIAWAGERGISKVEVQVDDEPWKEATLRIPPLSPLTWVQWRYDWNPIPGKHQIQVRAVDGLGGHQIEAESGVRPNGATGYHSYSINV
jgi:DMSO/TMAO reductase YedYZ molybdopterin-dependent catalytic subunit